MTEKVPVNGNGNGLMVAAIVGVAVGAGVALLFAPCSGKQTRGWLARRGSDIKTGTTHALEQGRSVVQRAAKLGRDVAAVAGGNHDAHAAKAVARGRRARPQAHA